MNQSCWRIPALFVYVCVYSRAYISFTPGLTTKNAIPRGGRNFPRPYFHAGDGRVSPPLDKRETRSRPGAPSSLDCLPSQWLNSALGTFVSSLRRKNCGEDGWMCNHRLVAVIIALLQEEGEVCIGMHSVLNEIVWHPRRVCCEIYIFSIFKRIVVYRFIYIYKYLERYRCIIDSWWGYGILGMN